MMRLLPALVLVLGACGTLATDELEDVPAPHNGVGPFRLADRSETGVSGSPSGRAIATRGAVEAPMVAEGHLFFANAELFEDVMPPDMPGDEIDWSLFAPRRVLRAPPGDDRLGFPLGAPVLEAAADWEGGYVTDPWALVREDGSTLLYYAGEGGIGLAEASSVDGAFTRVGDGPILVPEIGETLGRPSAVELEGTVFLYFETGTGAIALAESADGRSFTRTSDALALFRGPVGDEPDEVALAAPGATVATTVAGRTFVRLYLESRRADGTRLVSLAASADGRTFERLERPAVELVGSGEPGPMPIDERVSVLYFTAPAVQGGLTTRAILAGIAPLSASFAVE